MVPLARVSCYRGLFQMSDSLNKDVEPELVSEMKASSLGGEERKKLLARCELAKDL
jgi:hypothetical protein